MGGGDWLPPAEDRGTDSSLLHEPLDFSDYSPSSLHQPPLWCVHTPPHHSLYISHNEQVLRRKVELFNAAGSGSADFGFPGNTFCIDECQDPRNKFNSRQVQFDFPTEWHNPQPHRRVCGWSLIIKVWVLGLPWWRSG